jgi:predicted amidohydrolase
MRKRSVLSKGAKIVLFPEAFIPAYQLIDVLLLIHGISSIIVERVLDKNKEVCNEKASLNN